MHFSYPGGPWKPNRIDNPGKVHGMLSPRWKVDNNQGNCERERARDCKDGDSQSQLSTFPITFGVTEKRHHQIKSSMLKEAQLDVWLASSLPCTQIYCVSSTGSIFGDPKESRLHELTMHRMKVDSWSDRRGAQAATKERAYVKHTVKEGWDLVAAWCIQKVCIVRCKSLRYSI